MKRLKKLENIKLYHLHTYYDNISKKLIYNRELKEGLGNNFYGLDISKDLISDDIFIKISSEIYNEINNTNNIINTKTSNYNSNIFMDRCTICNYKPNENDIPLETHHIIQQKEFINGLDINNFHIKLNQKSNLIVLCHNCHNKIHNHIV
jgi:hypothetical protein